MGGNFILSALSGIAAVIALIDFEKCVYLEFRRLRVFSLIRPQLPGDPDEFRSHYLQRDRLALSRLSYKAK